jgi:hypothetical protein
MSTVQKPIIITPFCILQYNDPLNNIFFGFINYPTRIHTDNGIQTLECADKPHEYGKWTVSSTFYGFSSMIRPIPNGLKLINANKVDKDVWKTENIKHSYDPFNIKNNSVSFMTWTQPVSSTVPLYLHITPDNTSYPSFDKNPPSNQKGWTENKLSPLYVMVNPETHPIKVDANLYSFPKWEIDEHNRPIFKFKSSDGRCVPDINGTSIQECYLLTDEDVLHINDDVGQTDILTRLKLIKIKNETDREKVRNFFLKLGPYKIVIIMSLFIVSLVSCIILLSK